MTSSNYFLNAFFIIILSIISGCAAKAKIDPEFSNKRLITLAVLPTIDKTELPSDKMAQLTQAFEQELKNAGFLLLDQNIAKKICPAVPCADYSQLFSRHMVDGAVQLVLESSTRANFLAGYYNSLSGNLEIKDQTEKVLLSASATERERGGLLFNSGQILQGIASQVSNASKEKHEALTDKFLQNLVAQIPKSKASTLANNDSTTVEIRSVDIDTPSSDVRKICVSATPQSQVSTLIGKIRSVLPETSLGVYCRAFFLNSPFKNNQLVVEARSPFGNSVRKEVMIDQLGPCLNMPVLRLNAAGKPEIYFNCDQSAPDKSREFLVYRSSEDGLRFNQAAKVSSNSWTDKMPSENSEYVVIERSVSGDKSLPIFVSSKRSN
jgi:hypothetical protein